MKKKSQSISDQMVFCQTLPLAIEAGGSAQIVGDAIDQFEFKMVKDVESQDKENSFEETVVDDEKIGTEKTDLQDSGGVLIESEVHSPYETVDERFEELDIEAIEHFTGIPDYNTPPDSKYPFVVKTPSGYYCTDGWCWIEAARANGKNRITCNVKYLREHSDKELAIRKAALRVRPEAGPASYGEVVRNTDYLEREFLASNEDLKVYCHGGARKGAAFTKNTEDNVRKVLSLRLGRSVTTINQFLNHGAFLNDETLNFLAAENSPKEFFEKAQINKRAEITAMKTNRASDEKITAEISTRMLEWFKEYKATGKITPVWNEKETDTETGSAMRRISTGFSRNHRVRKSDGPQALAIDDVFDNHIEPIPEATEAETEEESAFDSWQGDEAEDQEDSDSLEKVRRDTEDLARRLLEAVALDDPELFYEQIVEEVASLHRISLRARVFGKEATV